MIRVLVADDQAMVRAGFRMILDAVDDIEVVGEAATGREAVDQALRLRPDVCLFDVRMPDLDGIEATRLIAGDAAREPLKVVIITTFDLDDYLYGALRSGASGFLLKNSGPELLIEAVRAAHNDEMLISPAVTRRMIEHHAGGAGLVPGADPIGGPLTEREEGVLAAVAQGLTNAEIADSLHVSLSTVKAHVANLMTKIGGRNRVELAVWSYETGRSRPGGRTD